MFAETCVGDFDEVLVKLGLVFTFFVSTDKHDGLLRMPNAKRSAIARPFGI
jgi:hypothetical protein